MAETIALTARVLTPSERLGFIERLNRILENLQWLAEEGWHHQAHPQYKQMQDRLGVCQVATDELLDRLGGKEHEL